MECDRGDSFPLDFEPNGIPFGSKSKVKLSPRSRSIQFEREWKFIFVSGLKEGKTGTLFFSYRVFNCFYI